MVLQFCGSPESLRFRDKIFSFFNNTILSIANHIENTAYGGFILTGTAGGESGSNAFIRKFDYNADSVYTKLYNQPELGIRAAYSVKQLAYGGYILAGSSSQTLSIPMPSASLQQVKWYDSRGISTIFTPRLPM